LIRHFAFSSAVFRPGFRTLSFHPGRVLFILSRMEGRSKVPKTALEPFRRRRRGISNFFLAIRLKEFYNSEEGRRWDGQLKSAAGDS
jgi:hypothetical protein